MQCTQYREPLICALICALVCNVLDVVISLFIHFLRVFTTVELDIEQVIKIVDDNESVDLTNTQTNI